jgi:hypothetical protein
MPNSLLHHPVRERAVVVDERANDSRKGSSSMLDTLHKGTPAAYQLLDADERGNETYF